MASDLPPTTKLVLHTVRVFMGANGRDARVSVGEIVRQSSLSRRAVINHLRLAYDAGWLLIDLDELHAGKGAGRKYAAKMPSNLHLIGAPGAPKERAYGCTRCT